jgi:glycine cleavage system H protein
MYPNDLKYSKEHEWVKAEGGIATIEITHHAQDALGDIVYTELPKVGAKLGSMQEFGVVESVKTVSTLYSPVSGEVIEVNQKLAATPEIVNTDPYGNGWMIKVRMAAPGDLNTLLSADQYQQLIAKK